MWEREYPSRPILVLEPVITIGIRDSHARHMAIQCESAKLSVYLRRLVSFWPVIHRLAFRMTAFVRPCIHPFHSHPIIDLKMNNDWLINHWIMSGFFLIEPHLLSKMRITLWRSALATLDSFYTIQMTLVSEADPMLRPGWQREPHPSSTFGWVGWDERRAWRLPYSWLWWWIR